MIKIVFCLKRLPSLSRAEFHDYWRNRHAPLVARHAAVLGIHRYVQCHTMDDATFAKAAGVRGGLPPYDGVAELWISDAPSQGTPEERRLASQALLEDERRFIDLDASPLFYAQENVVIDGQV